MQMTGYGNGKQSNIDRFVQPCLFEIWPDKPDVNVQRSCVIGVKWVIVGDCTQISLQQLLWSRTDTHQKWCWAQSRLTDSFSLLWAFRVRKIVWSISCLCNASFCVSDRSDLHALCRCCRTTFPFRLRDSLVKSSGILSLSACRKTHTHVPLLRQCCSIHSSPWWVRDRTWEQGSWGIQVCLALHGWKWCTAG